MLKDQLNSAKNIVPREVVCNLVPVLREIERLESSLRMSQVALQRFMDSSERNSQEAIVAYKDAEDLAMHIFD